MQGFTIKPHYFAPLLKSTGSRGDVEGKSFLLYVYVFAAFL